MASSSLVASSSDPPATQKIYEVFLSFSGETRLKFTAYLREKLEELGITETFYDETNLEKGESVYQLFPAIKQSRFAITVISPKYGSSKWCMDELVEILKCMKATRGGVLPVFYSVEPSDVGHQRGSFGEAFKELEMCTDDTGKVKRWKRALKQVSKIKGWNSKGRVEPELRLEVVEALRNKLRRLSLELEEHLVGIESKLKELDSFLETDSNDVRFIGIWGMSGIGKTTIAKKACERISDQFDAVSFLERVREDFKTHGATYLRRKLSNNLLKRNILDWNVHGDRLIHFLLRKKVLVILDDVDDLSLLEEFCKKPTCFGPGSRIIITTTNEGLLIAHGVERRFKVEKLNDYDALKLFSLKALKRDCPDKIHMEMSKRFVTQADGLPLALKLWGSHMCGRDKAEWSSELCKLEDGNYNLGGVLDGIRISYDGLNDNEKDNFLDIACFFKGMQKDRVVGILGSGINVLIQRSLVTVSDNMVQMHDSLQELGQAIVCQQSQEPGERSRLWLSGDIFHVLSKNTGTAAVEGITLDPLELNEEKCNCKAFDKMVNLRLLKVQNLLLPEGLKYLPNSLKFLEWRGFDLPELPPGFKPKGIVELSLCHSSIEQLWDGTMNFDNLKVIKLRHSKKLRRTDFEGVQNLEILDLEGCESLVDIDSIGVLENLKFLNLKDCKSLERLPEEIEMELLEILILSGCSGVKKIPEFVAPMESLWKICLDGTAIENIPSSVGDLTSLSLLELRDCVYLKSLPTNIGNLKSLKHLHVSGCSKLEELPESIGKLELLEEIDASGTGIIEWSSIRDLKNLTSFIFHGPKRPLLQPGSMSLHTSLVFTLFQKLRSLAALDLSDLNRCGGAIPKNIHFPPSLVSLDLSGNDFPCLPTSVTQLPKLERLCLSGCKRLKHVPALSSDANLEITADECTALVTLQYPSNLDRLNTSYFNFINSFGMLDNESYDHIIFDMLQGYLKRAVGPGERYEIVIRGSDIPGWFIDQRLGASLSVEVSTDWHHNKWMGYAACAVFEVSDVGWEIFCVLEIDGKEEGIPPLLSSNMLPVSDHLWLFYVSRDISFGTQWQNGRNQLKFSFQSSDTCLVRKCGVRLVYEQDVLTQPSNLISSPYYRTSEGEEELDEIVSQSSSTTSGNEAVDYVQEFNQTMTTTSSTSSDDSLHVNADGAEGTVHDAEDFNLARSQFSTSSPWARFMGWTKSCLGLI